MDKPNPGNDLGVPVTRFCLTLEEDRRTAEGRIRTSQEFLDHFCPHDNSSATDRIFKYLPNDLRGPILAAWGVRGSKTAIRDSDEKVQSILYESLLAGDIDHQVFEDGLGPQIVIRWVPLTDYWAFWRGGKLSKHAIRRALETGDELGLFDAKWFLDTVEAQGGKIRGTDVLSEGLSKADLTQWVRKIHESRDGSPRGLLAALGWESVVAKTVDSVLIQVLDAMAVKVGLKIPAPSADARAPNQDASNGSRPAGSKKSSGVPAPAAAVSTAPAAASVSAVSTPGDSIPPGDDLLTDDDLESSATPAPPVAAAPPTPMTATGRHVAMGNADKSSKQR